MMAKMFYTLDETKAALGKSEEDIKQLTREGRLREFRDGPRLMFKADQVEAIKAELGGGGISRDQIDIGVSDTGAGIPLVDSRGGSQSGIALIDSAAGTPTKDDTALAADLGLSGSLGGVPSPGRPGSSGLSGTAAGRSGINVFAGEDSIEHADPSAQTNVAGGTGQSSGLDQIALEGSASGSGLLDLTRERDDTSLGVVLDEISPGGSRAGSKAGTRAGEPGGSAAGASAITPAIAAPARGRAVGAPVYAEARDNASAMFGGASLGAAIFVIVGLILMLGSAMGVRTPVAQMIQEQSPMIVAAAGAGLTVVCAIFGLLLGKVMK